jgi:hypothetical protein
MLILVVAGYAIGILLAQGASNPRTWGALSLVAAAVYIVWMVWGGVVGGVIAKRAPAKDGRGEESREVAGVGDLDMEQELEEQGMMRQEAEQGPCPTAAANYLAYQTGREENVRGCPSSQFV